MATLNEVMKDTADAIREKTGKSELIKPVDFATEIKGITAGGGSGESASTIEYISTEGKDLLEWGEAFALMAFLVKMPTKIVTLSFLFMMEETVNDAIAFALDPTIELDFQGTKMTIADFLVSVGVDLSTYNRLTKEQFYDLNA